MVLHRFGDRLDSSSKRKSYIHVIDDRSNSPLKIFGPGLREHVPVSSTRQKFPELFTIYDVTTGDSVDTRIFGSSIRTDVDWTPTFQMPSLGHNHFNLVPSVTLANVDPGPFWIATERTNGRFVSQQKRLAYGLSASPTLYARFGGFGPFTTSATRSAHARLHVCAGRPRQ